MYKYALLAILIGASTVFSNNVTNSFYIRQNDGKCFEYEEALQEIVLKAVCREKFRWDSGARLIHVQTNKCLVPKANTDGSVLQLTDSCSGTDTLFQHLASTGSMKHLVSGKCIRPEANATKPAEKSKVVMWSDCSSQNTRLWLVRDAMYVIRHISGLCWVHSTAKNVFRLRKRYFCDRFRQVNSKQLEHVATGKCVTLTEVLNRFTLSDCASKTSAFDLDLNNILHETSAGKCVRGYGGSINPNPGTMVVLDGCLTEDRIKFYFYDDRSNYYYY